MGQDGLTSTFEEGPLSRRTLFELRLYSTFIFVFAALLLQFILTFYTASLLQAYSYPIRYGLFTINYLSESRANWTVDQVFLVFGSGPLIVSAAGWFLLFILRTIRFLKWKTRLAVTWMAFLMVNAIPCGLVAGLFFFDGIGIPFQWTVESIIARGVIAIAVLLILVVFNRYWRLLFLKTSFSAAFLHTRGHQKIFLTNIYTRPWIYGLIILMLFNWPFYSFFWPAFLVSVGYCAIPFSNHKHLYPNILIMKSGNKIFASRTHILYFIIAIVIAWIAGNFSINF
ncbi:MAG: hypothetical protein NT040_19295 [Bacteroidetes bacterium]|nr:hypothetical protein [Bacteroidota bacterium]